MIKKIIIKKIIVFAFLFIAVIANMNLAMADGVVGESTLEGLKTSAKGAYGAEMDSKTQVSKSLPELVGTIIGTALSFLGIVFLILMIYGGFLWMTDRGEGANAKKAKELIEAAIIGLIIVMSAYAITAFLGTKLTTGV